MKLGLDLRGGVHFLLEADTELLVETKLESSLLNIKRIFKEISLRPKSINISEKSIFVSLKSSADESLFNDALLRLNNFDSQKLDASNFKLSLSEQQLDEMIDSISA